MSDARYRTTISGRVYESHDAKWATNRPPTPRVDSLQNPGLAQKKVTPVLRLVGISRVDSEEQSLWSGDWPKHEVEEGPTRLR